MKLRLKELRQENNYTQKNIADYLNIKQNTYSQYESGIRELPLLCLAKLSELYKTSTDYILGLTDYDFPYPR
jgi:transcriptional regulator with XRE-family HTH domain